MWPGPISGPWREMRNENFKGIPSLTGSHGHIYNHVSFKKKSSTETPGPCTHGKDSDSSLKKVDTVGPEEPQTLCKSVPGYFNCSTMVDSSSANIKP